MKIDYLITMKKTNESSLLCNCNRVSPGIATTLGQGKIFTHKL
uniref:Uncharacterized protein n=1 Tax=Anguilla anguilla TaxID=7936 RepID=A0A0E9PG19_ANGAN